MYYEEKIIDGRLMCKTSPGGEWKQVSIEELSVRYMEMKNEIIDLKACL